MARSLLYPILLFAAGWLLFGKTLGFDFVQYDDPAYVTQNGFVNKGLTPAGLKWAFFLIGSDHELMHLGVKNLWHPLTWTSHMLDVTLFGLESAAGHHAVNVLLHTLTGVLVFFLGRRLQLSPLASFVGALLFLVHPTKAESVAWVSERKDVLSGFFFCAAFLRALSATSLSAGRSRQTLTGLVFFTLALMSKPSTVVLPPLIVLTMLWLGQKDLLSPHAWWQESKKWTAWFLLALLVALVSIGLQAAGSHQDFMASIPLKGRLLSMPLNLLTYFGRLLVPRDLTFHYLRPPITLPLLVSTSLAVVALLWVIWKTRKGVPDFTYGFFAFVLCWLPVSGLLYVGTSFTADRYLYLAALIPFLLCGKWATAFRWSRLLAAPLLLVLSVLCWQQLGIWKSTQSLFTNATRAQPRDPKGWNNLGAYLSQKGDKEGALAHYQKALSLNPVDYFAWHNSGKVHEARGDISDALEAYQNGIKASPTSLFIYRSKGLLERNEERYEEAVTTFQAAVTASKGRSAPELMLLTETQLLAQKFVPARINLKALKALQSQDPRVIQFEKHAQEFLAQLPTSVPASPSSD